VFCVETGEQVFELFYNTINPIEFGKLLCEVGTAYNKAFLVPESNNHGAAVVPYLKENYPRDRIYKRKYATKTTPPIYGWNNSRDTKHALVGLMQEDLNQVTIYGSQTGKELSKFEEDSEGKMEGKNDNLVIATGLAMLGLKKFEYLRQEYNKPKVVVKKEPTNYMSYTLDEILADLDKRRHASDGIFGKQVGEGYPNA
jgi:ABC-type transport system substrate-binding protein